MKRLAASLCLIALIAGCADSSAVDSEQPEDVGSTEQELGEAACSTINVSSDPTQGAVISDPSFFCSFWNTAMSPNAAYGTSGSACTSQFVTEVQNVSGRAFSFVARPSTGYMWSIDGATCGKLHASVGAYGHNASGWTLLGAYTTHGVWTPPSGGFVGYCMMQLDAGSPTPPKVTGAEGYDAVRVAGSAYTIEVSKGEPYKSFIQVEVGIGGGKVC
jgi:hypothetical protein